MRKSTTGILPDYFGGMLSENSIFFDEDDFENMFRGAELIWGRIGMTQVRICGCKDLKKCRVFRINMPKP